MGGLVTAEELAGLLGEVTVLDVRYQLGRTDGWEEYLSGHVPGAVYVDLARDLSDPPGEPVDDRGRHPLPDPQRFVAAMRAAGVRKGRPVVVYDDWDAMAATRAWWLLRDHGHEDVRVLDGGWRWWLHGGHPVETGDTVGTGDGGGAGATDETQIGTTASTPGTAPDETGLNLEGGLMPRVDAEGAARVARDGVLLDARAEERFRGEAEPVDPVSGHVPGAVSLPTSRNLEDGLFRDRAALSEAYAATEDAGEVAVYCGSGVTATHDLFALHLLGREGALYPGSWSGWVSNRERPVETGP